MNFGMFTDFHVRQNMSQSEAFDESFRQVEEAEKLGIDSVWLSEHHFSPERSVLASPLVIASSIATRTQRVRIGLTRYYQGYNVPYVESRSRFLEALEIITQAWTQEQFSYTGDHFNFHNVTVVPKPYQQPYPPIRVALASAETFTLVGRMGHAVFVSANAPIPQLQERLAMYRQARQEAGHTGPADIALRIPAYVAETAEQARSEPEASTMHAIRYAATELITTAANPEIAA